MKTARHDESDSDRRALGEVMAQAEADLRRLAHDLMRRERPGHVLQTTALVNEVYLRFARDPAAALEARGRFLRRAAQTMRNILVDHARRHRSQKRGGGRAALSLDEVVRPNAGRDGSASAFDALAVDEALRKLAALDPRQAEIVELRVFGGFSIEEVAELLEVSRSTVDREWRTAKMWLRKNLSAE